ncbi:MAG: dicarboxylate/amino acid:cation symporter, partial [Leptonema sp. (in: Bacteria)]|nr:dicarboxylate/amino acid:cation symporter [Leptonema sp. (in: bacteria)]
RRGLFIIIYFGMTTAITVAIGLLLSGIIGFGEVMPRPLPEASMNLVESRGFTDILLSLVSPNLFESLAKTEILPIIIFCIILGVALLTQRQKSKIVFDAMEVIESAIIKIVDLILIFAPFGIFGLIANRAATLGDDFYHELFALRYYFMIVLLGLLIHGTIILPSIYAFFTKRNPTKFMGSLLPVFGTCFATASSSATLPLTLTIVQEKEGVAAETAGFVLPLGATVNMGGTALYEAVAAMFIAHLYGIELDVSAQIIVFLTATLAAIGAAGIPEAGLVTMAIVLKAVGLPLEGIALILSIDWFLDRCRTVVNVFGDTVGAAILDTLIKQRRLGLLGSNNN